MHGPNGVGFVADIPVQVHQTGEIGGNNIVRPRLEGIVYLLVQPLSRCDIGSNFTAKLPPKPQQVSTSFISSSSSPLTLASSKRRGSSLLYGIP